MKFSSKKRPLRSLEVEVEVEVEKALPDQNKMSRSALTTRIKFERECAHVVQFGVLLSLAIEEAISVFS